ncbi:hypothetical protein [Streptomyces yangpuensis]|uniref:hypothetical protein n=1 Tax=Streptomyces yangpuensis TaxID=1648182 RepID=UPI0037FC93A4
MGDSRARLDANTPAFVEPDDEHDARDDQGLGLERSGQADQALAADQVGIADRTGVRESLPMSAHVAQSAYTAYAPHPMDTTHSTVSAMAGPEDAFWTREHPDAGWSPAAGLSMG